MAGDHTCEFGPVGSPPNFVNPSFVTTDATFPTEVDGFGFLYVCDACNIDPFQTQANWELLDEAGTVIESGITLIDFTSGDQARFFGVVSPVPFRRVRFSTSDPDGGAGRWFMDDLRYGRLAAPPAPFEVPTVSSVGLAILVLLIGGGALCVLRRRRSGHTSIV